MSNLGNMIFDIIFFVDEPNKLLALCKSAFLLSVIVWICIMPIVFNFFVIPKIEKRIRKKLTFPFKLYNTYPFGKYFGKHFEIAFYIFLKFLRINREPPTFALSKTNNVEYDIKNASKFEIVVSITDVCITSIFMMGVVIMIIKVPPSYLSNKQEPYVSSNIVSIPTIPASQNAQVTDSRSSSEISNPTKIGQIEAR